MHRVFSAFFAGVAVLAAADAGRVGENGTGALWIAPELVDEPLPVLACSERAGASERELVFERLAHDAADQRISPPARPGGGVMFEWNAETGELSFASAVPSGVFDDLQRTAVRTTALSSLNCASR